MSAPIFGIFEKKTSHVEKPNTKLRDSTSATYIELTHDYSETSSIFWVCSKTINPFPAKPNIKLRDSTSATYIELTHDYSETSSIFWVCSKTINPFRTIILKLKITILNTYVNDAC